MDTVFLREEREDDRRSALAELAQSVDQSIIVRQHVNDLLEEATNSHLITIVAGMGYGKSLSVYTYLKSIGAPIVWVKLSAKDNEPSHYWESFTYAVSSFNVQLSSELAALGFPHKEDYSTFHSIIDRYVQSSSKIYVVLDNLQVIEDNSVLELIKHACRVWPNIVVLMLSNTKTPFNEIAFPDEGVLYEITESQLAFTREDFLEYQGAFGFHLSLEETERIYRLTNGWPLAINLICIAIKSGFTINKAIEAVKQDSYRVFEEGFFSKKSPDEKKLLTLLSLIFPLQPGMTEIFDESTLSGAVADLEGLIIQDPATGSLNIQSLFADFLKCQQSCLSKEEITETYRKAGEWCLREGMYMEAAEYFETLCDYKAITQTLTRLLPKSTKEQCQSIYNTIMRMLAKADPDDKDAMELRYMHKATLEVTLKMFDEAEASAWDAIHAMRHRDDEESSHIIATAFNQLGFIDLLRAAPGRDFRFPEYFRESFTAHIKQPERRLRAVPSNPLPDMLCSLEGPADSEDFEMFLAALRTADKYYSFTLEGLINGYVDLAECEYAFATNRLDDAESHGKMALLLTGNAKGYRMQMHAILCLIRVAICQGDFHSLENYIRELNECEEHTELDGRIVIRDRIMGYMFTKLGLTQLVPSWLRQPYPADTFGPLPSSEFILRANLALCEKRYKLALNNIQLWEASEATSRSLIITAEILALKACVLHYLKEYREAMQVFEEAWRLTADAGVKMPFIEMGKYMRSLCDYALTDKSCKLPHKFLSDIRGRAMVYAKKASFVSLRYKNTYHLDDSASMTAREVDILTDMYHGLTRAEIADNMFLSVNTIKTVLQAIYTKLGADNNVDAVRIALEKKIILP